MGIQVQLLTQTMMEEIYFILAFLFYYILIAAFILKYIVRTYKYVYPYKVHKDKTICTAACTGLILGVLP